MKKTNVDSLAVAIGTSHGAYKFKKEPKLAFDILEDIRQETSWLSPCNARLKQCIKRIQRFN